MANGDQIADIWESGGVVTGGNTVTTIITLERPFTPTATVHGIYRVEAWVYGQEDTVQVNTWYQKIIATGRYTDSATVISSATSEFTHDPGTTGWGGLTASQSGNDILIRVQGAITTDILWHGEAKLKVIQAEITEA